MLASRRYATILAVPVVAAGLVAARGEPPEDASRPDRRVIRDGFESGPAELAAGIHRHDRATAGARAVGSGRAWRADRRSGSSSRPGQGSRFFVSEALPKVPVTEDLAVSLYVRSNRHGGPDLRLGGPAGGHRPRDQGAVVPAGPRHASSAGPTAGRSWSWSRCCPRSRSRPGSCARRRRRPVSLQGAYLERVVVNLMGGMGETDVFLDDLQVGPVPQELAAAWAAGRSPAPREGADARPRRRKAGAVKDEGEPALPPIRFDARRLREAHRRASATSPGSPPRSTRRAPIRRAAAARLRRPGHRRRTRPQADPAAAGGREADVPPAPAVGRDGGGRRRSGCSARSPSIPCHSSVMMWSIGEHLGRQREPAARGQEVQRIREVLAALRRERGRPAPGDGDRRRRVPALHALPVESRRHRRRPAALGHVASRSWTASSTSSSGGTSPPGPTWRPCSGPGCR